MLMIARPLHSAERLRYCLQMQIVLTKGVREDQIAIIRNDGSRAAFTFPKKGPLPHDAYHFFVERELGMQQAFWGLVADGKEPNAVGAMAAAAGHASSKRASVPDPAIVELLQAERLVECFEAESWSNGDDDDGIMAMAEAGWSSSHVPAPLGARGHLRSIRAAIAGFAARWQGLADGASMTLTWQEDEKND